MGGARFIYTNPDAAGTALHGILPATVVVAALITTATGKEPYFVGKPNPVMRRSALNTIEAHPEHTVLIGDRMDTDVKTGLEAGLSTILVRSGISENTDPDRFPCRPNKVVDSIADIADVILDPFRDGVYRVPEAVSWED